MVGPKATRAQNSGRSNPEPDLEEELRQAEEDFARGDYIELTIAQIDHYLATGECPWQDESRD